MWDIVDFSADNLYLLLRKRDSYFFFSYPWHGPKATKRPVEHLHAESINVPDDKLFYELSVRARIHAVAKVATLAKTYLQGKPAKTLDEMHESALKFALRRFSQGLIPAKDFLSEVKHCAILKQIPGGFWNALSTKISSDKLESLKKSMCHLREFNIHDEAWLESAVVYMSRPLWLKDEFQVIAVAATQLAICYPDSISRNNLATLGKRAAGLIMAKEIEKEQQNLKPWQRSVVPSRPGMPAIGGGKKTPKKPVDKGN